MNLRDIKKDIEYVVGSFIDDCTLFLNTHPGKQADGITNLIDKAVDLYNDLREKVVKGADQEKAKAYFNEVRKELIEKVDALYDELAATVKKILGD
jgi:cytochrome b involved in lipid metabolism